MGDLRHSQCQRGGCSRSVWSQLENVSSLEEGHRTKGIESFPLLVTGCGHAEVGRHPLSPLTPMGSPELLPTGSTGRGEIGLVCFDGQKKFVQSSLTFVLKQILPFPGLCSRANLQIQFRQLDWFWHLL